MPDTENCGRIPRKIPKTWSVEVVVGIAAKTKLQLKLAMKQHSRLVLCKGLLVGH